MGCGKVVSEFQFGLISKERSMTSWGAGRCSARYRGAAATTLLLIGLICLTGCQGVSTSASSQQQQLGNLVLGAQSLDFGSVAAGSTKSLTVTVTNSGSASVTINSATVSTKYYSVTAPALPAALTAGQSTTFTIEFAPNAAGTFNATVALASNASDSTVNLSLSGTGTSSSSAGQLTISPTTLAVGSVVDGTSGTTSGTLNASGASVTVTAVNINDTAFTVSGLSLPVTIAAGKSAPFTITFSPLTSGAASATLTVNSNAQTATTTATVTGTGTPAPTHTVSLSWNASSSPNIKGYNIYRAVYTTACGSYSKVNSLLDTGTLYTDSSVVDGTSYCYASTAVNTSNEESGYSNIVSNVQIPAP